MKSLVRVVVSGSIEDYASRQLKDRGPEDYKGVPVRFWMEDGTYDWVWVRKSQVKLAKKPSRGRK